MRLILFRAFSISALRIIYIARQIVQTFSCIPLCPPRPLWLKLRFSCLLLLFSLLPLTACLSNPFASNISKLEEDCDPTVLDSPAQRNNADTIQLEVWGRAYGEFCWRTYALQKAAAQRAAAEVQVVSTPFRSIAAPYQQAFATAAASGDAPDIAHVWPNGLEAWQRDGYLVPLDDCISRHAAFDDIIDELWDAGTIDGQVWGIPFEVGLHYFLFNKKKLRELGWSEERIAELPLQIREGEFTLDHAVATAHQAIEQGVVQPGFGFWPHHSRFNNFWVNYSAYGGTIFEPEEGRLRLDRQALIHAYAFQQQLLADQLAVDFFVGDDSIAWTKSNIWHDAVSHGRVLFWHADINDWAAWVANYLEPNQTEADLFEAVGYALYPSGVEGQSGVVTWAPTGFYAVASPQASGRKGQEAACDLLAAVVASPEINSAHAIHAKYMGVLKSQNAEPVYQADRFAAETRKMWPYVQNVKPRHPHYQAVYAILAEHLDRATAGDQTPTAAADTAIADLRKTLGKTILIGE